jgi:hypothetical protein
VAQALIDKDGAAVQTILESVYAKQAAPLPKSFAGIGRLYTHPIARKIKTPSSLITIL